MKREMPSFLFLVAMGLLMFFIYAAFVIGMDVRETIAVNRSVMSSVVEAAVKFGNDHRDLILAAVVILVAAKFFRGTPKQARS